MLEKIKQTLTTNLDLKILALLFAVGLWIIVVNVDDPTQTKTFTAKVQVVNEEVLTEQGKYYSIVDNNNTVSFRVQAKRSTLEKLSSSDFTAVADMNNLEDDKRIPVEITVNRSSVVISSQKLYLEVEVGDQMANKFMIQGEASGDPADGFAVDTIAVAPNVVTVKGPAPLVKKIQAVKAVCDVTGMNRSVTESVVPVFYDGNGDVVDTTKLDINVATVDVTVNIVSTKEVPIEVDTGGSLAEGLELESITTDPANIVIKGEAGILNDITAVTIPPTVITLNDISQTMTTTVDITSYLPEGVSLLDNSQAKVKITVKLAEVTSHSYNIPTTNLSVRNLGPGLTASFDESTVKVEVKALPSALKNLSAESITGYVDASGLTAGESITVPIVWNLGEAYLTDTVNVKITLKN